MQNKKIVIIGPAHPYRGGLSTFNERFAAEFAKNNQVEIVTFTLQYPSFLFPGTSQFTTEPAPKNLTIKRLINSINPISWIKTGLYLKKTNPDLVIFRYWMPFFGPAFGTIARIAKRNKTTRIACIADNIIPHEKKIIDKPFNAWFLPTLHGAITMSKAVLEDLNKTNFKGKAAYYAHPLYDNLGELLSMENARLKLQIPKNVKVILFFGFIRAYKGLDLLLEAMQTIEKTNDKIHLLIAGEFYEDKEKYESLFALLNSSKMHLHTNFIPNSEVNFYFSACNLVVQPYKTATQSGVSQVAYHFNKPMLVTNVGGLFETVIHKKTGLVCEPNPTAIAKEILNFFKDDTEIAYENEIIAFKKQFSWENLVLKMEEVSLNA